MNGSPKVERKKPLLISCGILKQEIDRLISEGKLDVETFYLSSKLHSDYNKLEKGLSGALQKYLDTDKDRIIVVYGDVCLGFQNEMKDLLAKYGVIKVDALNCIDCLLGGRGRLLEIDPDHKKLFLNPAFIEFGKKNIDMSSREDTRKKFSMLDGIILLDALGDLDDFQADIDQYVDMTGLPIAERLDVGLEGLCRAIEEAVGRL